MSTFAIHPEPEFVKAATITAIAEHLEDDGVKIYYLSVADLEAVAAEPISEAPSIDVTLIDWDGLARIVGSMEWWIDAAANIIGATGGYTPRELRSSRDRFIDLEGRFWEAVAPARRHSIAFVDNVGDICDQRPAVELIKRYMAYRRAVCELARETLPASICRRLEART